MILSVISYSLFWLEGDVNLRTKRPLYQLSSQQPRVDYTSVRNVTPVIPFETTRDRAIKVGHEIKWRKQMKHVILGLSSTDVYSTLYNLLST